MHRLSEKQWALVKLLIIFMIMGFAGWYENYVPAPVYQDSLPRYATVLP